MYGALEPAAETVPGLRDELRALPVPLADGRTVPGPASVLLPLGADAGVAPTAARPARRRPRRRAPAAAPPRAPRSPSPDGLLDHPALRDAVDRSVDDADAGLDPVPLAEAVLGWSAELGPGPRRPATGWRRSRSPTSTASRPARTS